MEGAGQRGDMGFEGSKQSYPLLGGGMGLAFEHLKCFSVTGHKNLTVSMRVSVKYYVVKIAKGFQQGQSFCAEGQAHHPCWDLGHC